MEAKFKDLQRVIGGAGLTQGEVAVAMGYREDVFSKTLRGVVPPKGRATDSDFRRAVKNTVRTLSEGSA